VGGDISEEWRVQWRLVKRTVKCGGIVAAGEVDSEVWKVLWRLVKRTVKCGGYCSGW